MTKISQDTLRHFFHNLHEIGHIQAINTVDEITMARKEAIEHLKFANRVAKYSLEEEGYSAGQISLLSTLFERTQKECKDSETIAGFKKKFSQNLEIAIQYQENTPKF